VAESRRRLLFIGGALAIILVMVGLLVLVPQKPGGQGSGLSTLQPPVKTDADYLARLRGNLLTLDVDLRDLKIDTSGGQRTLVIAVGEAVAGQVLSPYNLVTGIQFVAGASLIDPSTQIAPLGFVEVIVYPASGDPYLVQVGTDALTALMHQSISEGDFVRQWQISSNAPPLNPNQ
jgi:hypothetical protein